ncbi:GNAT family N-acetyltransferase [Paenibacillus contaminans]|uniref:GNAT family N-acetyltransferase n=1 Tax=Paenibacillus contaminans TaxID=450362 RepID=A0A329MIB1_9BACL|nr:GNAT family N-acetyltransferase [Paenibacillus contaminans]RAV19308.1 GNAT family N-acetyltransferase [Paenibacillus contaminans]
MKPTIKLYDAHTIDRLPWPDTEDGEYARRYLEPLVKQGTDVFIANVLTSFRVLLVDDIVLPVTVNEREYGNAYVCSPYTHYVTYAKQELVMLNSPLLERVLKPVLDTIGLLLKASRINKVVHVNNWLLSTNLYPALSAEQLEAATLFLARSFPRHAVVFRSVNGFTDRTLPGTFRNMGFTLAASRQIYLLDPADPSFMNSKARWLLKRDHALIAKNGYNEVQADELLPEDMPRIRELYNDLYLGKYSADNPQFTERFFRLTLERRTLNLTALRHRETGRIDAVLGYFYRNGVMTTPVFGYDTKLSLETGLYRMLSAMLIRIASENGRVLNESSGAAQFKRNRGAVAEMEYSAVYTRHLPFYRRLCWSFLAGVANGIGVPLMVRKKL